MGVLIITFIFMYTLIDLINDKEEEENKSFYGKIKGHLLEQNGNNDTTVTQSSQTCRKLLSHKGHNEYLISI